MVSVVFARSIRAWKETVLWQIDPVQRERKHVALLNRGFRLKDLSAFITVISEVAR
jgi:hypothetical protein